MHQRARGKHEGEQADDGDGQERESWSVLPIFAAAIVGGLGQSYGAIAGGFLIGFAETLAITIQAEPETAAADAPAPLQVWIIDSTPETKPPGGSAWDMLGIVKALPPTFASRTHRRFTVKHQISPRFSCGLSRREIVRKVDVLPQPDGPSRQQ